jgi:hypothetical protein
MGNGLNGWFFFILQNFFHRLANWADQFLGVLGTTKQPLPGKITQSYRFSKYINVTEQIAFFRAFGKIPQTIYQRTFRTQNRLVISVSKEKR